MTINEKKEFIEKMSAKLKDATTIVIVDYRGIKVAQDTELRKKMREAGAEYVVAKNRLVKLAMKDAGIDADFDDVLEGTNSFAIGYEDAVAPAKVAYEFGKDLDIFEIKAGYLEGRRISAEDVKALATLPSRDELLAKLLSSMQSPISGIVNVMQGNIRKLVYALDAIAKQK